MWEEATPVLVLFGCYCTKYWWVLILSLMGFTAWREPIIDLYSEQFYLSIGQRNCQQNSQRNGHVNSHIREWNTVQVSWKTKRQLGENKLVEKMASFEEQLEETSIFRKSFLV